MEKANSFYIPCKDCSLKPLQGKYRGMILDKDSYKCVFGYNDCENISVSNKILSSGRKISDFSELEKEIRQNREKPFLDNENLPENSYNRQEPFFPTGKTSEKRLRLFPE